MNQISVGVVGLGIMGGAMARNMCVNGLEVVGYDATAEAVERLASAERFHATASVGECLSACDVMFTSLPSVEAFESVMAEIASSLPDGKVVVDVSTLPLAVKEKARAILEASGCTLLDCPVSGTGAQAIRQDLVVFGSGEPSAFEKARPALEGMSRRQLYLGRFGTGTTMKFLANHLVAIHNAAAGEAFALAASAGVDLQTVFETLQDSAATSRMYQMRGPLMVADRYDEPTARISMFMKDLDIITDFAADLRCPTPLFNVSTQMYYAADRAGYGDLDTAAVARVFEQLAGLRR